MALLVWPMPLISLKTPSDQLNALRMVLLIGGAAVGAITLLLAARRQVHSEHVAQDTVLDAAERRITELYVKAVEQLGSDKAPVRLGGLYALERLADSNPDHRQTVVDVICSYLRMPYNLEVESQFSLPKAIGVPAWLEPRVNLTAASRQEREVRIAAQEILCRHLQGSSPLPSYAKVGNWGALTLNLKGAVLIDFNAQCMITGDAQFDFAQFHGLTMFNDTRFEGYADFTGSSFEGVLLCESTAFVGSVSFMGAKFNKMAYFRKAQFGGFSARFRGSYFGSDAHFHQTVFSSPADFHGADFQSSVTFASANFMCSGVFQPFQLASDPFDNGTSSGSAEFVNAQFHGDVIFDGVNLAGQAGFQGASFHSRVDFQGVNDDSLILLDDAYVRLDVPHDVERQRHWPHRKAESTHAATPEGLPENARWGMIIDSNSVPR
jgi:uncharacterized protein YjbI with pentapeptide repeats